MRKKRTRGSGGKRIRRMGALPVVRREDSAATDVDTRVELIQQLIPLGLMHVQEVLRAEVAELAGVRHARKTDAEAGSRYGSNPTSVSRSFVEASAAHLKAFQERDLSEEDYVALFLDGKVFADATMVIALGVTITGEKRVLGFIETDTENARVLSSFLRSLVARGLDVSRGILVIIDGGKGLRSAVRKVLAKRTVVQRCTWHSVPGMAHSKEVRCLPSGRTLKPDSLRQVAAA